MSTFTETPVGAYSGTPHQTIEQLCSTARSRVTAGEAVWIVIQDIVNGYSLGWQSANHNLIEAAAKSGVPHTPAPWRYEAATKTIRAEPSNYWLASMNSWEGMVNHEANARLIAAAPELLEQLKQLAASYAHWMPRYGDPEAVNSQLMQNVRAAIAKATA